MLILSNPLADQSPPAPLTEDTLADLDSAAADMPGIRGELLRLGIDYQRTVTAEHRSQMTADPEGQAAAYFDRLKAAGVIDRRLDNVADDWLAGLSNAAARRPLELMDLVPMLLEPALKRIRADLRELAEAVAALEGE